MSLFLMSDTQTPGVQDKLKHWLAGIGPNPSVGYLASSADPTREYFAPVVELYDQLGAEIIAFAEPIHGPDCELYDPLFECDIIHLCGGNTFEYLHHLGASGLISRLQAFVEAGGHLVGVSAGAILMTPDIATAAYCGDEAVVPFQTTRGLNLVPFHLLVHVADKDAMAQRLEVDGLPGSLYLMDDNDVIEVGGGEIKESGSPRLLLPM